MENNTISYVNSEARFKFAPSQAGDTATEFFSAGVQAGRHRQMRTAQIAGLVLAAVSIILLIIPATNRVGKMAFGFALLIAFVPTFMQMSNVYNAAKKVKKNNSALPALAFFDDKLVVERENSQITEFDYSHIIKVKETEKLFMLAQEKGGSYCVEKSKLVQGSIDDFRAFISEKTGKNIECEKYVLYDKRAWIKYVIVIAAVYFIGMGANFVSDVIQNAPQEFTDNEYAITLTRSFERNYDDENDRTIFTDGSVDVICDKFPGFDTNEWYSVLTDAANKGEISDLAMQRSDIGMIQYEYVTSDARGTDMYVFDTVISSSGKLYLTRFVCPARNKDKYKTRFEKWSDTIIIGDF